MLQITPKKSVRLLSILYLGILNGKTFLGMLAGIINFEMLFLEEDQVSFDFLRKNIWSF